MKKTFNIILTSFAILTLFSGVAFAGAALVSTGTDATGIETTHGDTAYPNLENINMSPNVDLGYNIAADSFAVNSYNSKGVIEYGLTSENANIYFTDASADNYTFANPTASDETAFEDYAVMGGGATADEGSS